MSYDYLTLARALLPETSLVIGALLVLGYDLFRGKNQPPSERLHAALLLGATALIAAIADVLVIGPIGSVYGNQLRFDTLATATRVGVLVLSLLTLGVTAGARAPRHAAEYVAILLFATIGFTLMSAANHLLVAFAALELASLSLYILTGFAKDRRDSAEAALKYFLFGGLATAFLLFGFSLIYGVTGQLDFRLIGLALAHQGMSPLLIPALVMVLVAFGFKAAAAPFHLWAPDAYEGAPASSAALIASASKLAGFTLFLRLLWPGLAAVAGTLDSNHHAPGWLTIVALLSAASLLLGNFGALAQTSTRRLLAYSAIAHTGAMLLGVIAAPVSGAGPLFYYVATYGVATVGAFGVLAVLEANGVGQKITDLAGLSKRSPFLAACLTVFILSLAGIPPLAGFFGKFSVFAAAIKLGGLSGIAGWLTALAILLSAVALYYYLLVLKQALVAKGLPTDAPQSVGQTPGGQQPATVQLALINIALVTRLTLLIAAAVIVALGVFPSLLLDRF